MKTSITSDLTKKYINKYLENSGRREYTELKAKDGLVSVLYEDLNKTAINGYPIASDFVDENGKTVTNFDYEKLDKKARKQLKLRYHFLPNSHELYVGTTGSGKQRAV